MKVFLLMQIYFVLQIKPINTQVGILYVGNICETEFKPAPGMNILPE